MNNDEQNKPDTTSDQPSAPSINPSAPDSQAVAEPTENNTEAVVSDTTASTAPVDGPAPTPVPSPAPAPAPVEPVPPAEVVSDSDAPAAPVPPMADNGPAAPATPAATEHKTDVLGIVSIIMAFIGMQLIGFILGLVGASKAKKEGRSPTLSKVGWILNLVFGLLGLLIFAALMATNFQSVQAKARDTERISDVNALYASLETYYNQKGYYPAQLKTSELGSSVTDETLKDAKGGNYSYKAMPSGCTKCGSYTLKADLEDKNNPTFGGTYTKQSLNEEVDL